MEKYVILLSLILLISRIPVNVEGMILNCDSMSTIEGYSMYAQWCPLEWPYQSIVIQYANNTPVAEGISSALTRQDTLVRFQPGVPN